MAGRVEEGEEARENRAGLVLRVQGKVVELLALPILSALSQVDLQLR